MTNTGGENSSGIKDEEFNLMLGLVKVIVIENNGGTPIKISWKFSNFFTDKTKRVDPIMIVLYSVFSN